MATKHPADPSNDPTAIPAFSVIRAGYRFKDEAWLKSRLWVCLAHLPVPGSGGRTGAFCLKCTSNLERYQERPELMAGVVVYASGETDCFEKDTVVQPDNPVLIPHDTLKAQVGSGDFTVVGQLPDDFREKLAKAIGASVTLEPQRQESLLKLLHRA